MIRKLLRSFVFDTRSVLFREEDAKSWQRWLILVCYWSLLMILVVYPFGYIDELFFQATYIINEDPPFSSPFEMGSMIQAINFLYFLPVLLRAWSNIKSIHDFHRRLSLFSAVVYPLGQILDTFMWCASFDFGVFLCNKLLLGVSPAATGNSGLLSVLQFIAGFFFFQLFLGFHRSTLEQWYLPLHHFPPHKDPKVRKTMIRFIFLAIASSAIFAIDWFMSRNLVFLVLLRCAFDLCVCIRIRIPAPWQVDLGPAVIANWHKANAGSDAATVKAK